MSVCGSFLTSLCFLGLVVLWVWAHDNSHMGCVSQATESIRYAHTATRFGKRHAVHTPESQAWGTLQIWCPVAWGWIRHCWVLACNIRSFTISYKMSDVKFLTKLLMVSTERLLLTEFRTTHALGIPLNWTIVKKLRPEYCKRSRSMAWLLIPWLLTLPGHKQQWCRYFRIKLSLSSRRKYLNNQCHLRVANVYKISI